MKIGDRVRHKIDGRTGVLGMAIEEGRTWIVWDGFIQPRTVSLSDLIPYVMSLDDYIKVLQSLPIETRALPVVIRVYDDEFDEAEGVKVVLLQPKQDATKNYWYVSASRIGAPVPDNQILAVALE